MKYSCPIEDAAVRAIIDRTPFATGTTRLAFNVASDPGVVVKKTKNRFPGPNVIEWLVWNALKETDLRQTFGECLTISWSGNYLVMERLSDIQQSELSEAPPLPTWMNDVKGSEIFGKSSGGLIKVRDYAMIRFEELLVEAHRVARW